MARLLYFQSTVIRLCVYYNTAKLLTQTFQYIDRNISGMTRPISKYPEGKGINCKI